MQPIKRKRKYLTETLEEKEKLLTARHEYEKRRRANESEESKGKEKENVQMDLEQRDWQPNLSMKDKKLQMK